MLNKHTQHGAALITGLIFMVVLTLLAVAAMRTTSLDEKMAGNALNQDAAFQATEAALREGLLRTSTNVVNGSWTPASFVAGCVGGLCRPATGATPIWVTIFPFGQTTQNAAAITYAGAALLGVVNQPQYIVERLQPDVQVPQSGNSCRLGSMGSGGCRATPYRVTARGWGLAPEAQATTQATYLYY